MSQSSSDVDVDATPDVGETSGGVFDRGARHLPGWAPWVVALLSAVVVVALFKVLVEDASTVAMVALTFVVYVLAMFFLARWYEGGRTSSDRMATTLMPGAGHAIMGTLQVTASTALISIPLGIFTAIYLVEYRGGWLSRVITFLVDIMTGIPSIVAGLFAAAMLPVLVGDPGYRSGFMGSLALVVLMTPIVIRNTEEMLRLVSNELREAAYALGVTKSRTIVKVVLRTALPGIVSGCVIAVARIIGESAPLLITAGSTDYYNFSLFNDRVMTLPVFVYNQYVAGNFPLAWAGALVLVLIVLILNLVARIIAKVFAPAGHS